VAVPLSPRPCVRHGGDLQFSGEQDVRPPAGSRCDGQAARDGGRVEDAWAESTGSAEFASGLAVEKGNPFCVFGRL
jgi:hypothetical protein